MTEFWGILAGVLAAITVLCACGWDMERQRATALRIRAEEAEAWADEHQREADAANAELDQLRERHAVLLELYAQLVRHALAQNYIVIERNLEWKRRKSS